MENSKLITAQRLRRMARELILEAEALEAGSVKPKRKDKSPAQYKDWGKEMRK